MRPIRIGDRWAGPGHPAYVIAEIGSNFDGDLAQAKQLADLAKECGADAAKFQSFRADQIVSRTGFRVKCSFQANWDRPVYDVYRDAEFPRPWHRELAYHCRAIGIDFFSSPYDRDAVDLLCELDVPAIKIGSGDITHFGLLRHIAHTGKPLILGTGASTLGEVEETVDLLRGEGNDQIILLQCVTQYPSPIDQANIRAMQTLAQAFDLPVGYSDHAPGLTVPLGAVALGACVIEKHFTCDKTRRGPDHPHALDPGEMKEMVRQIRLLEQALGSTVKRVEPCESETIVLQRRCLFAATGIRAGQAIAADDVIALRPMIGIPPKFLPLVIGRLAQCDIPAGEPITWDHVLGAGARSPADRHGARAAEAEVTAAR
jgi:sialic acid synthase SpsE